MLDSKEKCLDSKTLFEMNMRQEKIDREERLRQERIDREEEKQNRILDRRILEEDRAYERSIAGILRISNSDL